MPTEYMSGFDSIESRHDVCNSLFLERFGEDAGGNRPNIQSRLDLDQCTIVVGEVDDHHGLHPLHQFKCVRWQGLRLGCRLGLQ